MIRKWFQGVLSPKDGVKDSVAAGAAAGASLSLAQSDHGQSWWQRFLDACNEIAESDGNDGDVDGSCGGDVD